MVKLSTLKIRIITACIIGPASLIAMWVGDVPFLAVTGLVFALSVKEWRDMTKLSDQSMRDFLVGSLYLVMCFSAFLMIRFAFEPVLGALLVIGLMVSVWSCDTGAYFSGKTIGGAKLAPKISPNKTWAGLIGGTISGAVGFVVFMMIVSLFSQTYGTVIPLWKAAILGALLALVGQVGDLLVSWYKRRINVKDTGDIIPGHGGILDRIDSLMLATLFFLFVLISIIP